MNEISAEILDILQRYYEVNMNVGHLYKKKKTCAVYRQVRYRSLKMFLQLSFWKFSGQKCSS